MDFNEYVKSRGYKSGDFIPKTVANQLHSAWLKEGGNQGGAKTASGQSAPQDESSKAALIQASLGAFEVRKEEAQKRGVEIPPEVSSSIEGLIGTGKIKEASDIQDQILGKIETATEREARIKGQKETKVEQEQALRSASDAAEGIRVINKLTSSEGFPGVFGAGIGLKYMPGSETRVAEGFRKKIVSLATTDTMRKFQGLGQMSDKEFGVAQDSATLLSDPGISEERAAEELNRLRSYFATSIRRAENLGRIPQGTSEKMISDAMAELNVQNKSQSASDRLRAKRQQNGN